MEDEIAEIADKSFSLYKLTPLYKFQEKKYSELASSLSDYVCRTFSLKDPRKRNHSKKISYTGELLEIRIDSVFFQDVATYDASVEPLKITIEIMTYSDHKSVVYLFFLLPSSYVPASNTSHNYSHYPLVLVKASSKVKSLMIEWFRQEYLASFAPLYIPPLYMKYMINIWVESIHNLPDQDSFEYVPNEMIRTPLKLEYKRDDKNLSSIEIELKQDQVIEICSKLIDKNMFLDVFHEHVLNTTKVNLNSLTFYQVQNSLAVFRRDGSVKVSGHAYKTYAVKLLQSWIDLAVEKITQSL